VIQFEYPFGSTPLDPDESIDEIASRFHHQLLLIIFSQAGIDALRKANRSDYSELLSFVKA